MNPHANVCPVVFPTPPREDLIAVWPDETWCAYADIVKMRRDDNFQLMRVTRRGKHGEPVGFERLTN